MPFRPGVLRRRLLVSRRLERRLLEPGVGAKLRDGVPDGRLSLRRSSWPSNYDTSNYGQITGRIVTLAVARTVTRIATRTALRFGPPVRGRPTAGDSGPAPRARRPGRPSRFPTRFRGPRAAGRRPSPREGVFYFPARCVPRRAGPGGAGPGRLGRFHWHLIVVSRSQYPRERARGLSLSERREREATMRLCVRDGRTDGGQERERERERERVPRRGAPGGTISRLVVLRRGRRACAGGRGRPRPASRASTGGAPAANENLRRCRLGFRLAVIRLGFSLAVAGCTGGAPAAWRGTGASGDAPTFTVMHCAQCTLSSHAPVRCIREITQACFVPP